MLLARTALLLLFAFGQCVLGASKSYYNVLGLDKQATDKQIKSAYRQLSKKYHPDKNPNDPSAKDKFVEVSEAYEALIDEKSRQDYDRYGHEAYLQRQQQQGGGGGQHHDPFDLFSRFFGGGGHFGSQGQRRGQSIEIKVGIALRDFYVGRTTEFQWDKQQICEECAGTGGHGIRIVKHQLAPGMYQQVQMQCDACGGRGKTIKHKCPACGGARVVRKPATVSVTIQRGMADGTKIAYENEADASPDYVAGDLIVTLVEKDPDLDTDNPDHRVDGTFFRRKNDDLFWREVLSLREGLDGRLVPQPDPPGRPRRPPRPPRGQVVQPGHVETVPGEGMPKWHEDGDDVYHKTEFGNLFMDRGMEKDFHSVFQKWRGKVGVDLHKDSGRPDPVSHAGHDHEEL
ncbi:hypothetical protein B0T22DRAFT_474710 [Podospora appendiculata]|uniref:Uncharacterized protein n=1 Tax=Podospora appendiculata TaxID=314037 RepID=A0AAE0WYW9_9PEZI|nr:hypothetical protein B0T22DRAFT_474710 [Podospora appendiculata]